MTDTSETSTHWTDGEWDTFTKWLKGVLKTGPVKVTFTKKDGTERVMNCTLDPKKMPQVTIVENKEPRKKNDNVLPVYDLDQESWRSFTIRSVKRIEFSI